MSPVSEPNDFKQGLNTLLKQQRHTLLNRTVLGGHQKYIKDSWEPLRVSSKNLQNIAPHVYISGTSRSCQLPDSQIKTIHRYRSGKLQAGRTLEEQRIANISKSNPTFDNLGPSPVHRLDRSHCANKSPVGYRAAAESHPKVLVLQHPGVQR